MRHRFGVLVLLPSLVLLSAAGGVVAQTAAPAAGAQPFTTPQVQPSAAAGAPSAPNSADQTDNFNLTEALRGGQPLSSKEAAERAVQTGPTLAQVEAQADKAEAAADQANIAVYPKLDLEARYTRVNPVRINLGNGPFDFPENQGLLQARLSWPVSTLFFSIIPRHEALVKLAEAQKLQTYVERQGIKLRAREAYYSYARARAALMVARSALAQSEAQRKDSEALVSAGSVARVELVRAEARVASQKVAFVRAEFSVTTARSALFTLLHLEGNQDVTISENLEEEIAWIDVDETSVYKNALSRRSELKALRLRAEAQEKSITAARGQGYPSLAVGGTVEEANPNQRYLLSTEWKPSWALYASLVWTPTETWNAAKAANQSRADLAATQADYRSLQDSLRVEVSQAYNGLAAARATLESARAGIAAAEESYRVRREQFRAGAAIAVDVIESQNQLVSARLDLVNALIDTRVARARIDRAIEAE